MVELTVMASEHELKIQSVWCFVLFRNKGLVYKISSRLVHRLLTPDHRSHQQTQTGNAIS